MSSIIRTFRLCQILLFLMLASQVLCQTGNQSGSIQREGLYIKRPEGKIYGSLVYPESDHPIPLVIFISGSGPTDRDGNSGSLMKNNSLKKLAGALSKQEIASFRFDKKGVGASHELNVPYEEIEFMDMVKDIAAWTVHFNSDERFSKIILLGHSLGSLYGIKSAQLIDVDALICLAGPGYTLDKLIYRQLLDRSPFLAKGAKPLLDSLASGERVKEVNPLLQSIIPPNLQNYLISVFSEDPAEEIKKLEIPVLVIVGTHDVQASVDDANSLDSAASDSKLVIIEGMNHVLVNSAKEFQENIKTYNQAELELNTRLLDEITLFIHELKQ